MRPHEPLDTEARSGGPPWILGARGSPLEAPENTRASLLRALDLGLDGIAYDARAARGGEVVLLADRTLERTTDGAGPALERTLQELGELDAGGWFDARFRGEKLVLFEEALGFERPRGLGLPQHVVHVDEPATLADVARIARSMPRGLSLRVAVPTRAMAREARDLALEPLFVARALGEDEREWARRERLTAVGGSPRAWSTAPEGAWSSERWVLEVDLPDELLAACRAPFFGLTTHEPLRALEVRALARLTPDDDGPYPIRTTPLEVWPGSVTRGRGDWCGAWETAVRVRNPFGFACRVAVGIVPRRGAFEISGVPVAFVLAPREERDVPFTLTGGSWRPGGDPCVVARMRWRAGPGRAAGQVTLDAPLVRTRTLRADALVQRLEMLRESTRDREATLVVRRHRRWLFVSIENAGGHDEARTIVHLDGREWVGGRGLRVPLPEDFDEHAAGVAFSCGFLALRDGERIVRRWAGGVPAGIDAGAPGRLVPTMRA